MASSQQVAGLVGYYLREGYPDSVSTACDILLQRCPGDAHLRFWKAFALQATGNISQVVTMFRLLVHFVCLMLAAMPVASHWPGHHCSGAVVIARYSGRALCCPKFAPNRLPQTQAEFKWRMTAFARLQRHTP